MKERVQRLPARRRSRASRTREDLLKIKGLIRETEARAGGAGLRRAAGAARVHGPAVLPHRHDRQGADPSAGHRRHRRPAASGCSRHQIYVAGELSDPHGTHRTCAEAIFEAVRRVRGRRASTSRSGSTAAPGRSGSRTRSSAWCRSARSDLERKKNAIFRHQSQKDRAMFPGGTDRREFWQRAEDRNRDTAKLYDQLGLPEFYALEGFVQWRDE